MVEPSGPNREEEAGLVRYPEYRNSGVDWLGEIPAHWEVRPLRTLARRGPRTFTDGDWIESPYITGDGVRLVQTGNVGIGHYKEQGFRYVSEDTFHEFGCTEIRPDDVLICRLAHPVGRACLAPDLGTRMITSVDVCILKPAHKVVPSFLVYSLSASDYLAFMGGICRGGTRDRVSRSTLGSVPIRVPPLWEQYAIAKFLDKETTRIDALVAKQQELIRLLQEKRTALISHAVTKGLGPDVAMQESGVEWLGEIPAHWEVAALQYRYEQSLGKMLDAKRITGDHLVPYLRNVDVQWDHINLSDLPSMDIRPHELDRFTVRPGDLLVCEGGEAGRCAIWDGDLDPCGYQKALHRLRPLDNIRDAPRFLYYTLSAAVARRAFAGGQGSTIGHLTGDMLRAQRFPFPPTTEQRSIVRNLDRETAKIDALIARADDAIAYLNEYRTALISSAVTGKIDVRNPPHTDPATTTIPHPTR